MQRGILFENSKNIYKNYEKRENLEKMIWTSIKYNQRGIIICEKYNSYASEDVNNIIYKLFNIIAYGNCFIFCKNDRKLPIWIKKDIENFSIDNIELLI